METIVRHLESAIREDAAFYPAITLFGPRQAGKTTLVRHCFEIDLVLRSGRETRPVEIKSAAMWNPKFSDALERYARDVPGCARPTVVYDSENQTLASGVEISNCRSWNPQGPFAPRG